MRKVIAKRVFEAGSCELKKYDIEVDSSFNESKIPKIKDFLKLDLSDVVRKGSVNEAPHFSFDMNHAGDRYAIREFRGDSIIDSVFSRLLSSILKAKALKEIAAKQGLNDLSRTRIREESEELERVVASLANLPILGLNGVFSNIDTSSDVISFSGVYPKILLFENVFVEGGAASSVEKKIQLKFAPGIPSSIQAKAHEIENSVYDKLLADKIFSGVLNLQGSSVQLDRHVVSFLVNNRKLLINCSDLIYNMTSYNGELPYDSFVSRGYTLNSLLTDLSIQYPFLRDSTLRKDERISSIRDLYQAIYGSDPTIDLLVQDIDLIALEAVDKDYQYLSNRFSLVDILLLKRAGKLTGTPDALTLLGHQFKVIPNSRVIKMCESILALDSTITENLVNILRALIAVTRLSLKIENVDNTNIEVSPAGLLPYLDSGFITKDS